MVLFRSSGAREKSSNTGSAIDLLTGQGYFLYLSDHCEKALGHIVSSKRMEQNRGPKMSSVSTTPRIPHRADDATLWLEARPHSINRQ